MISVSAPLPARVWAYLLERFPPAAYTVLVGLFTTSAVMLVGRQTAVAPSFDVVLRAGAVVLLVFLHLRLMDEHKDYAADAAAYPDRCLSRGVVTLPLLFRLGVVAVVLEAVLAVSLSIEAAVAYAEKHGLDAIVQEPHLRKHNIRAAGYAENFSTT